MFDHYIITRFNIHEPSWRAVDLNNQPICNDAWLQHRFKLFERYCLPSVMRQTNQNFKWVILLHHKTKDRWRKLINQYIGCYSAIYLGLHWLRELQNYLRDEVQSHWIITTRLDNDDVIYPNYIENIQALYTPETQFITAANGYQLYRNRIYTHVDAYGPFASYVEPHTACSSVYFTPHGMRMLNLAPVTHTFPPSYLQIIHDRNYLNSKHPNAQLVRQPPAWVKKYIWTN